MGTIYWRCGRRGLSGTKHGVSSWCTGHGMCEHRGTRRGGLRLRLRLLRRLLWRLRLRLRLQLRLLRLHL
jgi:hypothetical protein